MSYAARRATPIPDGGAQYLSVDLPWDGGTTTGLGLGATMSCFVEQLGDPDQVEFERDYAGDWWMTYGAWSSGDYYLTVWDWEENSSSAFRPDGLADHIGLYGLY